jgi:hypothetical protein
MPGASDTEKFLAAAAEFNKGTGKQLYIPWIGREWTIDKTITFKSSTPGDYLQGNIVADPFWNLINYRGADGTSAFRFIGTKRVRVTDVCVRTFGNKQVGFEIGVDADVQSTSNMQLLGCRVQFMTGSKNSTGFLVGSNEIWPNGSADVSSIELTKCEAYSDTIGGGDYKLITTDIIDRGHIGYQFVGGNTLANKMDSCNASGCLIGINVFGTDKLPNSGSSGMYVVNFGTSYVNLIFRVDGGFPFYAHGGRHEIGGSLFSHGSSRGYQATVVPASITDMIVDDFMPYTGAKSGLFTPGAMFSFRNCCRTHVTGMQFGWYSIGERPASKDFFYLAHNNVNDKARVYVEGCAGITPGAPIVSQEGRYDFYLERALKIIKPA